MTSRLQEVTSPPLVTMQKTTAAGKREGEWWLRIEVGPGSVGSISRSGRVGSRYINFMAGGVGSGRNV